jgi:uncharacterized radical SAM superfamily Fe-S cluster-containing enzyme
MDSPQKNYYFLEYTTSLCPECLNTVPGKIVARDGRVYIKKQCVVHGRQEELLEDNAAYFIRRNEFSRPGSACELQTETDKGCPFDCGLCPDHEQHTCIGLIEVNTGCDMCCPTCYAEAGRPGELTLPTIQRMIDFYIASEYCLGAFCLLKTTAAFGFCPASKLFVCMCKGGCYALTKAAQC